MQFKVLWINKKTRKIKVSKFQNIFQNATQGSEANFILAE